MTDWTVILTSLGAAGIAGTFGYLGARMNARVALRQVEAENERLRAQHREDHLRNRQGTYHGFFIADRRFTDAIRGRRDPRPFQDDWHSAGMGVLLFGSERARRAIRDLIAEVGELMDDAKARGGGGEGVNADALKDAWDERSASVNAAKDALLEAMRADVGPEEGEDQEGEGQS